MMGSADAYGRSHYGKASDAYGLGSSSAYDMSREPSSSRAPAAHSHSGSWHSPSSHDPYYPSSNDGYRRDDYDVSVSTHKGWRDHAPSSAHHAAVHDDPYSSSSIYPDSQGWVPRHESRSSGYEKWPAHDDHYHIDDRAAPSSSSWHRSRDDSPPVDWRRGDSGWETTRHDDRRDNGWDNVRRGSAADHRVQEDRSWEPAPSWRSNHQESSAGSGQQRYQNRKWGNNNNNNNNNNNKGNTNKKKKNHHKSNQHYHNHHHQGTSGRDWRERDDDRGPNKYVYFMVAFFLSFLIFFFYRAVGQGETHNLHTTRAGVLPNEAIPVPIRDRGHGRPQTHTIPAIPRAVDPDHGQVLPKDSE
jgi:hypothetical protein